MGRTGRKPRLLLWAAVAGCLGCVTAALIAGYVLGHALQVWAALGAVVAVGLVVGAGLGYWQYRRRTRLYRALAAERQQVVQQHLALLPQPPSRDGLAETFRKFFLVRSDGFLTPEALRKLQQECLANQKHTERTFIPVHKKGGTLSYESLHRIAPAALSIFHSEALRRWVSDVVGAEVRPCADHDQSACSILYYDEPGDHINWHFDHNFYRGRHFTVLLSLVNQAEKGGASASQLLWKDSTGQVTAVDTSENSIVLFEGARVLHRASPTEAGDLRIILSMTYSTDPRLHWFQEAIRRCKDTAYYGLRALWD